MKLFKKSRKKLKLAVLASGRGSNFQSILKAIQNNQLNAEICLLLSDNDQAKALEIAQNNNIPNRHFLMKNYNSREEYEHELAKSIKHSGADLIILAGYMKILGKKFVKEFKGKILNIHPALLPAFPGLNSQKKALEYGVKYSGCTVHFVDEGVDSGPIILQRVVPVKDDDTEETLSKKILKEEHDCYWRAVKLIADNKIQIKGRKVITK